MSLSDLASIGSLVSGMAVLVSLIYLSLQVRQTERNQRALINQGVADRASENIRWLAEPLMINLTCRVNGGETKFTVEELQRLRMRLRATLLSGQDSYVQHKVGLADQITFDNLLGVMRTMLSQPIYRALWRIDRAALATELAAPVIVGRNIATIAS